MIIVNARIGAALVAAVLALLVVVGLKHFAKASARYDATPRAAMTTPAPPAERPSERRSAASHRNYSDHLTTGSIQRAPAEAPAR